MEVFLTYTAAGVTHAVDIGMDENPDRLKLRAREAFPYPDGVEEQDVELSVGGKALCDDEPLCSHAGVKPDVWFTSPSVPTVTSMRSTGRRSSCGRSRCG
eukprot:TRINITY_DN1959_c0_g3_i2.p1 TRINITY_DN1959_c0_g3~~TRINITY_DN1959_c0_g3_i2.p1  ORF type:complete len:117 (+),score=29.59 TRINITY_DN1959_c0_g3_i2:52-351(+)